MSNTLALIVSIIVVVPLLGVNFRGANASFFRHPTFLLAVFNTVTIVTIVVLIMTIEVGGT